VGRVDLDLLAIEDHAVELLDGGLGSIVVGHCYESIALLGDVYISDLAASGELVLQGIPGAAGVNSVDKKLRHSCSYKSVN
jgi:hypothetical protein